MYPDLYLYVEQARARELRADARRHARAGQVRAETRRRAQVGEPGAGLERRHAGGSVVRALEVRLGWVLVEAGLRLVHRYH
ncbi:hypothetical protein [Nonomuraea jabiensis]|uniref:Uncharacterized protein n=1 Tax=Nonomuraea jabiensis TaxID=882448 RepID=A0A7W9LBB7_9ACTN|nr:hypothetical protein [Nonomuraea jabiensis]MBB5777535.1 hypothetical protein [Nonomuraea jabiensis]